jgi:uncharacterized membrane protein YqhA
MWRRVLSSSRFVVIVAVIGTLASAQALVLYGAIEVVRVVREASHAVVSSEGSKIVTLGLIQAADLFLLGIVLFIIAMGLYALFVDDTLPLPPWLQLHDLEDLKANLISVVIAVLAVLFLSEVVKWDGRRELLGIGVGIAAVIAGLTFFLSHKIDGKD